MTKDEILSGMNHHACAVAEAEKARDLFLKEATRVVVAQHELNFDIGDILTRDGRLWYKVVDFHIVSEGHDLMLMTALRRADKTTREAMRRNTQLVSAEHHPAIVLNKRWQVINKQAL